MARTWVCLNLGIHCLPPKGSAAFQYGAAVVEQTLKIRDYWRQTVQIQTITFLRTPSTKMNKITKIKTLKM